MFIPAGNDRRACSSRYLSSVPVCRVFRLPDRLAPRNLLARWGAYHRAVTDTSIAVVEDDESLEQVFTVREEVFVQGQGVPLHRERDEHDDEAIHLLARENDTPVGTARLRRLDGDTAKVERVAVRESYRGEGRGRRIVKRTEAAARERGVVTLVLHSQTAVEGFYERLGYETTSDAFEDAGIPHVEMEKSLE